jgi:hypothetical protein
LVDRGRPADAVRTSCHSPWEITLVPPHQSTPTRERDGSISRSTSRRFWLSSGESSVSPVTLPPGRARLLISPCLTASPLDAITMGIVFVLFLTASEALPLWATMTSGLSFTSSAASSPSFWSAPPAYRTSRTTLRPST